MNLASALQDGRNVTCTEKWDSMFSFAVGTIRYLALKPEVLSHLIANPIIYKGYEVYQYISCIYSTSS
jgi:hypothetical protein